MRITAGLVGLLLLGSVGEAVATPPPTIDLEGVVVRANTIVVGFFVPGQDSLSEPGGRIIVSHFIIGLPADMPRTALAIRGTPSHRYGLFFLERRNNQLALVQTYRSDFPAALPGFAPNISGVRPLEAVLAELCAVLTLPESVAGDVSNGITLPAGSVVGVVKGRSLNGTDLVSIERPSRTRLAEEVYSEVYDALDLVPPETLNPTLLRLLKTMRPGLGRLWTLAILLGHGNESALDELSIYAEHPSRDAQLTDAQIGWALGEAEISPLLAPTIAKLIASPSRDIQEAAVKKLNHLPLHPTIRALRQAAESTDNEAMINGVRGLCSITKACGAMRSELWVSPEARSKVIAQAVALDAAHRQ